MRQTISVLLLGAAGFGIALVLERYVTALPEWAWRVFGLVCLLAGIVGAALTDTGWVLLRSARPATLYVLSGLIAAGFGIAAMALIVKPLLVISGVPFSPVTLKAYTQPGVSYPEGTILGGIPWQGRYVDVRVDISSESSGIRNLDFLIGLDTSIAGIGQISQIPDVVAFPAGNIPAAWLEGYAESGTPVTIPIVPIPGTIAPVWRVQCPTLFRNTLLRLVIASVALTPTEGGKLPEQLFAPRRAPVTIKIEGGYEVNEELHPLKYTHSFTEH